MHASCSGWLCLPAGELVAQHSKSCRHPMQSAVTLLASELEKVIAGSINEEFIPEKCYL